MDMNLDNETNSEMNRRTYQTVGAVLMGTVILIALFMWLFVSGVFVGDAPTWLLLVGAVLLVLSVYYLMMGLRRRAS